MHLTLVSDKIRIRETWSPIRDFVIAEIAEVDDYDSVIEGMNIDNFFILDTFRDNFYHPDDLSTSILSWSQLL